MPFRLKTPTEDWDLVQMLQQIVLTNNHEKKLHFSDRKFLKSNTDFIFKSAIPYPRSIFDFKNATQPTCAKHPD